MIKSSLLHITQNGSFQSPWSLWEQEFRSPADIRQLSTVFFVSYRGVIECDRAHCFWYVTQNGSPGPLFSVGTGAQPLSVNRQPCLCVSLDCSQQLIQNCIRAWSFLNDFMVQHQFLKTMCVFKWSKCFNRQCRHPSFEALKATPKATVKR